MMIGSTSSSSYTYEVVDDNDNSYRILVMDARRMNQHYLGEGSHNIHLDEELNVDATKFLELLKGCDVPL
jgi:PAB1-binding protein PBP1